AGIRDDIRIDRGPIWIAGDAAFVAAPANVRPGIGEHDGVRLQTSHERPDAWPIITLTLAVRSLTVRTVEPHLGDLPISREQLGELLTIEFVVSIGIAVGRIVPVPRGQLQDHADALAA